MSKKLTRVGIAITLAYLVAAVVLGWGERDKFLGMEPNQVGDFLAGVVGPLALLWLILGYFQQGEELRQSSLALAQQAEELRRSVEQQQALVEVTRAQMDAQVRSFQAEALRWHIAEQPIFVLTLKDVEHAPDGSSRFSIRCRNDGKAAVEVRVNASGRALMSLYPFWFPDLPNGQEVLFELEDAEPNNFDPIELVFVYADATGRPRRLSKLVWCHPEFPSGRKTIRFKSVQEGDS